MKRHHYQVIAAIVLVICSSFIWLQQKPVLFIIGDSTVKNGSGKGESTLWGWGSFMADHFDTTRISVENHAIGGRSSRTFITDGRWDRILDRLKPGDYVIMQFGHNDGSPLDDTARARGTIKGIGDDSAATYNPIRKVNEVVYSYGHYMRKYIDDTKAKGAIPIVCSPVPRDNFKNGKVDRANTSYGLWAQQVAASNGAFFMPLNDLIADQYDVLGVDSVNHFYPSDHTHTNKAGAELNVAMVVKGIQQLGKCDLKKYIKQ